MTETAVSPVNDNVLLLCPPFNDTYLCLLLYSLERWLVSVIDD